MTTISSYQQEVDQWIKDNGVRYFNELTNLSVLMEEVGELSSLMARKYGEQSFKTGKEPDNIKDAIADEMSDVLFVLTCLANQMDINLDDAIHKNMIKKTNRDGKRHIKNVKLVD